MVMGRPRPRGKIRIKWINNLLLNQLHSKYLCPSSKNRICNYKCLDTPFFQENLVALLRAVSLISLTTHKREKLLITSRWIVVLVLVPAQRIIIVSQQQSLRYHLLPPFPYPFLLILGLAP